MDVSSNAHVENPMIPGLSISIVTCGIDKKLLTTVLDNVQQSVNLAQQQLVLDEVQLHIIDNGHEEALLRRIVGSLDLAVTTTINNTNIGFGRAHNMAINASIAEYHLILNPDAITDVNALTQGIRYLTANPDVELVAPAVLTPSGEQHHLCRRYPSLFNLFLRGFMPRSFTTMFNNRLAHYEYRELSPDEPSGKITLASGCFMLCRTSALQRIHGFSEKYFLYFEDYDLSLRLGEIAYLPSMKIVHHGGGASLKGLLHIFYFCRSAVTFYRTHGWLVV